jgi:hypothetical protein
VADWRAKTRSTHPDSRGTTTTTTTTTTRVDGGMCTAMEDPVVELDRLDTQDCLSWDSLQACHGSSSTAGGGGGGGYMSGPSAAPRAFAPSNSTEATSMRSGSVSPPYAALRMWSVDDDMLLCTAAADTNNDMRRVPPHNAAQSIATQSPSAPCRATMCPSLSFAHCNHQLCTLQPPALTTLHCFARHLRKTRYFITAHGTHSMLHARNT